MPTLEEQWAEARKYFAEDEAKNPVIDPHKVRKMRRKGTKKEGYSFVKFGGRIWILKETIGQGAFSSVKDTDADLTFVDEKGKEWLLKRKVVPVDAAKQISLRQEFARDRAGLERMTGKAPEWGERKLDKPKKYYKNKNDKQDDPNNPEKFVMVESIIYQLVEKYPGKELFDVIDNISALTISERLSILLQSCLALLKVHQKNIIHGDVKPENFVAESKNGNVIGVKTIDYGLSSILPPGVTEDPELIYTGTPDYMPLSYNPSTKSYTLYDSTRTFATDVYAIGIMLKMDLNLANYFPPDFVDSLVNQDRTKRPSLSTVINTITERLSIQPDTDTTDFMKNLVRETRANQQALATAAKAAASKAKSAPVPLNDLPPLPTEPSPSPPGIKVPRRAPPPPVITNAPVAPANKKPAVAPELPNPPTRKVPLRKHVPPPPAITKAPALERIDPITTFPSVGKAPLQKIEPPPRPVITKLPVTQNAPVFQQAPVTKNKPRPLPATPAPALKKDAPVIKQGLRKEMIFEPVTKSAEKDKKNKEVKPESKTPKRPKFGISDPED